MPERRNGSRGNVTCTRPSCPPTPSITMAPTTAPRRAGRAASILELRLVSVQLPAQIRHQRPLPARVSPLHRVACMQRLLSHRHQQRVEAAGVLTEWSARSAAAPPPSGWFASATAANTRRQTHKSALWSLVRLLPHRYIETTLTLPLFDQLGRPLGVVTTCARLVIDSMLAHRWKLGPRRRRDAGWTPAHVWPRHADPSWPRRTHPPARCPPVLYPTVSTETNGDERRSNVGAHRVERIGRRQTRALAQLVFHHLPEE